MSLPRFVRVHCIRSLARLTADGFRVPAPRIAGPWTAALDTYAAFTAAEAERALRSGSRLEDVQARLFSRARRLGGRVRAGLVVRSPRRAASVMRALYEVIGVEFSSAGGEFTVTKCHFAARYSPAVCGLVSSLDAGLFSGLSGGGELLFRGRITEGAAFCGGAIGEVVGGGGAER